MKNNRAYALAGIAMLGFGLMLGYAFYQLMQVERSLANFVGENMLWAVNQADRETRRFTDTLLLDGTNRDLIALRLDILNSRIDLLDDGPQLDYFKSLGAEEQLKNIVAVLKRINERFRDGNGFQQSEILSLYREIQPAFNDFGRIANLSMIYERDKGGANRDTQLQIIYLTMAAVAGLMTVGGILSLLLIVNMNSAHRANQQLRRHQEELEAIVEQRTQALSVALKNEQKSNEIYKGFLTTVSHQFKTPIAIIDLIAQRFIRHPQDINSAAVVEASERIRDSVARLSKIIESTISGDIIEGDKVRLNMAPFDLVAMVRQTIDYHNSIFGDRCIRFTSSVPDYVYDGDQTLLEQIIVNLLANAEKYSPGDREVVVTIEPDAEGFVCRVRDYGVGIPVAETDKIFSRFFRASNVAHLPGSGLGLSFSRQIAEMHGGKLILLTGDAEHTEFELRLPGVANG